MEGGRQKQMEREKERTEVTGSEIRILMSFLRARLPFNRIGQPTQTHTHTHTHTQRVMACYFQPYNATLGLFHHPYQTPLPHPRTRQMKNCSPRLPLPHPQAGQTLSLPPSLGRPSPSRPDSSDAPPRPKTQHTLAAYHAWQGSRRTRVHSSVPRAY